MKILVVDDDELAAEMTGAVLEDLGHAVVLAENGIEAAQILEDTPDIELIISDMNMPLLNGIELFRTLRDQGCTLPYILLTGDEPQSLLAQEPRLDACVPKDFTLQESLPQTLATVLARRSVSL